LSVPKLTLPSNSALGLTQVKSVLGVVVSKTETNESGSDIFMKKRGTANTPSSTSQLNPHIVEIKKLRVLQRGG
jgi:hypothetical protein